MAVKRIKYAFLVKSPTLGNILYISNIKPFLTCSCYPYTSVVFVLSYSGTTISCEYQRNTYLKGYFHFLYPMPAFFYSGLVKVPAAFGG